jgi:asparagine synthase (glutamine-hydrolysing)
MGCIFGYCGKPLDGLLDNMAATLSHRCARGRQQASLKISEDFVVEIGRGTPLWQTDVTHQVASRPDISVVLGFSGVVFNWGELGLGRGLLPDNDRAAESFHAAPEAFLEKLDGSFAFAAARGDQMYLARDCGGAKVIYWTARRDRLVFASEIKALFADPDAPRKLRLAAIPEYFTFSYIPGPRTMFEGIYELQPGSILKYSSGDARIRRHFTFEDLEPPETDAPPNAGEFAALLRADLEQSVKDCCAVSKAPPAVFLSGGIDSSAVLAVAARMYQDVPIKTYSVHFGPDYANENEFVSMMVDRYQTDHTWLEIRPSAFLERLPRIVWTLDDPIGDPITVPNYLLAEKASEFRKTVLNGEGGDPCFGGPKNIPMILSHIYGALGPADHWIERDYLRSYRRCFDDLQELLDPEVFEASGGEESLISIVSPFFTADKPTSFLNKLMAMNIRLKGANLILVKVDKMTSANGILALAPLFTKRIVENSMRCPPSLKLQGNREKSVLKAAVEDIVPRPIIERPKSGMLVPVRFWFRYEMRRYAKRFLSKKNLKKLGFFDVDYVRRLLDYDWADQRGGRHGIKLWMLITFMLWHQQMIEAPAGTHSSGQKAFDGLGLRRISWGEQ